MNFEIEKHKTGYTVDLKIPERCGSPTIGTGLTEADAIIAFFIRLSPEEFTIIKERSRKESIEINGTYWEDMKGSGR